MKRDMDLVRLILLKIEDSDSFDQYEVKIEGYDYMNVAYHCQLLYEEGYVSSYKPFYADNDLAEYSVGQLTWKGQDYLDQIRDNSRWQKIKNKIAENGLPLGFEAVVTAASTMVSATVDGAVSAMMKNQ